MKIDGLKAFAEERKIKYGENEAMSLHTSFKIGGGADVFLRPKTADELASLITVAQQERIPFFILGSGSNLIVSDGGIEGAVISTAELSRITLLDETTVYAEAGASLAALCSFARDKGLTGLEFAYGIPGSVGGAVYMNAGAYGGDISSVILSAESLDASGERVVREGDKLGLGYRKSIFKDNGETIIGASFRLEKGDPEAISATMTEIIGKRKKSQPLEFPSAGSTFKRPEGYFAAALIDECGLKGRAVGGAMVSEKHAGFVINYNKATCRDVLDLVEVIKQTVKAQKGVDLETEIIFVGRS